MVSHVGITYIFFLCENRHLFLFQSGNTLENGKLVDDLNLNFNQSEPTTPFYYPLSTFPTVTDVIPSYHTHNATTATPLYGEFILVTSSTYACELKRD